MNEAELLKVWSETRDPAVSVVLDSLLPVAASPYRVSWTAPQRQAEWLALSTSQKPEALASLLSTLHDGLTDAVEERIVSLGGWPPDPRIASAFTRLVEQPSMLYLSTLPAWKTLQRHLVRTADPRALARLEAVAAMGLGWVQLFRPQMRGPIAAWLEQTRDDLARAIRVKARRPLTAAERSALEGLRVAPTAQAALEAVWAAPDDLSARLVYADMLTAAGDPRGEFITLQCLSKQTAATRKRAQLLLALSDETWLGPLEPFVAVRTWERGFPSVVMVTAGTRRELSTVLGHPAWSTIHTIELTPVGIGGTPLELITHPTMTRLERVAGLTNSDVRALVKMGRSFPFRSLLIGDDVRVLRSLAADRFPALESVHLTGTVTPVHHEAMAFRPEVSVGSEFYGVENWPARPKKAAASAQPVGASSKLPELVSLSVGAVLKDRGQPVPITDILELGTQAFGDALEVWDPDEMKLDRLRCAVPSKRARVFAAMSGKRARTLKLVFSAAKVVTWRRVGKLPRTSRVMIFSRAGTFEQIDSYIDDAPQLIDFAGEVLAPAFEADDGAALVDIVLGPKKFPLLVWRHDWFGGTLFAGETADGAVAALLVDGVRAPT